MKTTPYPGETAAATVAALLRDTFAGVEALRSLTVEVHRRAANEGRIPTASDLESIRPTVLEHLSTRRLCAGTGVIAAPGTLADKPRWLEWWRRPPTPGDPFPLMVDLDPSNVSSYEYPLAPWFDVPFRTGRRVVVGPYVDYAGTDEYVLTFACPITSDTRCVGVAAANIRATDFERVILPTLNAAGPATLLINSTGRVLASNTPTIIAGSIIHPDDFPRRELPDGSDWSDCVGLPWFLVRGL